MEQRSQHGQQHAPGSLGAAPWPGAVSQQPVGPMVAQQPAAGFVLPGTMPGQAPAMGVHDGTIGTTPVHAQEQYAYAPPQAQQAMVAAPPSAGGYAAHVMAAAALQPQAWAYPTPNGLQLVQAGGAPVAPGPAAPAAAVGYRGSRRRIRWETIVPMLAVACLVATAVVLVRDWDRITGTEQAPKVTESRKDATDVARSAASGAATDDAGVVRQARGLMARGQYADASNLLAPLTRRATPYGPAVRLQRQVRQRAARNTALLRRIVRARDAKQWTVVLRSIDQVAAMRPLSADLVRLRASARRSLRAERARAVAAAKERSAAPTSTGGGGAPRAGGVPSTSTGSERPPANVAAGDIPERPDAPAPSGPQGTGAAAVGGGPAGGTTHCTPVDHGGVTMCM